MTSVRGQGRTAQRIQAFEGCTDWSNNREYEDPLGSNESGPSEAAKALIGPPKAPLPTPATPNIARYIQKDINHLFQTFLQASKGGSGDKLKAKIPYIYHGGSYMEYYNFCQQYKDYFATCGATGPNRILFAASFLRDRINFRWQQHKRKLETESSFLIFWDEFKAFLQKALGDSQAFVDNYWTKIRRDSQYQ